MLCCVCNSVVPDSLATTAPGRSDSVCVLCKHYLPATQYACDVVQGKGWEERRRKLRIAIRQWWCEAGNQSWI